MRVRTLYWSAFFLLLVLPASAWGAPTLLRFSQEDTLASTRLRLEFSSAPPHRLQVSGQRVDLFLAGAVAHPELRPPFEDNRIIRTLLAQRDDELMVSVLVRRHPARVHAGRESDNVVLLEMFWDEDGGVRPSLAFRVSGMPAPRAGAGVMLRPTRSDYSGRWEAFFEEYRVPLRPTLPLFYSLPPRPHGAEGEFDEEIGRLVREGRWSQLSDTLRRMKPPAEAQERAALAILRGEALVRSGAAGRGLRALEGQSAEGLSPEKEEELAYLIALAASLEGDPYLARLRLSGLGEPSGPYLPHIRLLQGEIALAIGRPAEALETLEDDGIAWTSAVRSRRDLRLADAKFLTGRVEEARSIYRRLLVRPELLMENPFSLGLCAESFAIAGEDEQAAFLYEELAKAIPEGEAKGLALVAAALLHLETDRSRALTFLNLVRVDNVGDEAGHRARLKMLDLDVLSDDEIRRAGAEQGYAEIAHQAFRRELREEAAFKRALLLALTGEKEASIEHLIAFSRDFAGGALRREAGALLRELVPSRINDLIARGDELQALVLVERTRDDLLAGGMDLSFLLDVAQAAARLGLFERALRVYLYLLDGPGNAKQKESLYLPLIELASKGGQYGVAIEFARRYRKHYPQGEDGPAVFAHHLLSLKGKGRIEEAADLLRVPGRPRTSEVELLAAQIFWEVQDFPAVAATFEDPGISAPPKGLLLRAEALRHLDRPRRALPLYRILLGDEAIGDQAAFRAAQIELSLGDRLSGLNLLRHLAEEGRDPLWRRLAAEALATEKM